MVDNVSPFFFMLKYTYLIGISILVSIGFVVVSISEYQPVRVVTLFIGLVSVIVWMWRLQSKLELFEKKVQVQIDDKILIASRVIMESMQELMKKIEECSSSITRSHSKLKEIDSRTESMKLEIRRMESVISSFERGRPSEKTTQSNQDTSEKTPMSKEKLRQLVSAMYPSKKKNDLVD